MTIYTMDTEESRKRPASSEYGSSSVKRLCQQGSADSSPNESPSGSNDNFPTNYASIPSLLSIKEMLSVPLEYIFRQCPSSSSGSSQASPGLQTQSLSQQSRPKPLLSRTEASCLIRIQCLAAEIDSLVQLSTHVLMEQVEWMGFHDELALSGILSVRALLPILLTLGQTFVNQRLRSIQADLAEILKELESLAETLQQSREANWNTYEALCDAGCTNAMALEKYHLCVVQYELATRIESLVKSTLLNPTLQEDGDDEGDILNSDSPMTMAEFCRDVWKEEVSSDNVMTSSPLRQSSSQNSRMSIELSGKENEPSQHSVHSAVVEDSPACLGPASQHAALALSSLAYSTTPN